MYLWLNRGDPPWELVSYILRRDIYHCLPSELDEEPWENVQRDIVVANAIARTSR